MGTAILLIAHGSRQAEANADLHSLADKLRERGLYDIVEPAFLELADPTIEQAAKRCVEQGAERVILLPYFLSAGMHVREDLEDARRRLAEQYPAVRFCLAEPLGPHPALVDVLTQRAREMD
jgi:sirohydrochlorin ferrochelatase